MPFIRSRNAALLLAVEAVAGTFQAPNASTDGVLVESPQISFNPQNVETNEVTGSLDGRGPIVGGIQAQISGSFYLKGSGEPGVAPEWGDIMKVCGWSETMTKTDLTGITFSVTNATTIADSGSGLAVLTVGTPIFTKGFANAANNGEFIVTTSAAGSIAVTKPDGSAANLVVEAAGGTVTIRRGVAAVAATAGSQISATLQAPWAASAQLYRGMPALFSGNPVTPAWAFLSDYTAARIATLTDLFGVALSASTKVGIAANTLYQPTSAAIPSASAEMYMDGVKYQFRGLRGNVNFSFDAAGACRANFTLSGLFVAKSDAAVPTPGYDIPRPPTWRGSAFLINRLAAALNSLTLDSNAQITFPDDPNQSEGFSPPEFTSRRLGGSMDPLATLVATRDIMSDFRSGASRILHARVLGGNGAVGNRIGLTIPASFYESYDPGDREGLATEGVRFFAQGQDSGAQLVAY